MEAATSAAKQVVRCSGGALLLLIAVIWPAVTITYELATRLCAEVLFDPLPTLAHLALVAAVPVLNLKLWLLRRAEVPLSRGWLFAGGISLAVSFSYTLLLLPVYPIAVIGIVYFGLGLLPFAPLVAGIATLILALKGRDRALRVAAPLWSGALVGLVSLMALDIPMAVTRLAIRDVEASEPQQRDRAVNLMRRFGNRELLLRSCYVRSGLSAGILGLVLERTYFRHHSVAGARELYYRLTGDTYDSVPPPGSNHGWRFARGFEWDRDQGGAQVGGRLAGLELANSRIDASMDADDAVAYLEWTAEFANRESTQQREARLTLALPPGGVVSRATLWVNGVEREASFAARELARAAYESVVRTRRDPLLVTTNGADQVLVQVFPVPENGSARIRIGITAPLELGADDRATLAMPAITDRNFSIGESLRHAVWIEGEGRDAGADAGFASLAAGEPLVRKRADFSDRELSTRRPRISLRRNPKASEMFAGDVTQTILLEPREPAGSLFVVLDGSIGAASGRDALIAALNIIPTGARVGFALAASTPVILPLDAWSVDRRKEVLAMLAAHEFQGGEDNHGALVGALLALDGEPRATLLWVHAPQKHRFAHHQFQLEQMLDRGAQLPGMWLLPLAPGPNLALQDPRILGPARTLAWSGDAAADVRAAIADYFDGAPRWTIRRNTGVGPGLLQGSQHAEKLWAFEEVGNLIAARPARRGEAIALASRHRLVTPVSGAVVLETDVEYLRAGLTPPDASAVPTIPEPEAWAMLIIGCLAFAWAWRRRRHVIA